MSGRMIPNIDYSLCTGCGGCADAFPQIFEVREEKAWVVHPEAYDPSLRERMMTVCPYYAISLVEVEPARQKTSRSS